MNVYLIFEFRKIREKRERKYTMFRVMFRVKQKMLRVNKEYNFLSNFKKFVIEKKI